MNMTRLRKLALLLVAGALLPVTITCDPADWVSVVDVADVVVVDDYGCCGYWDGGGFGFYY
jgi:hypothetical protein